MAVVLWFIVIVIVASLVIGVAYSEGVEEVVGSIHLHIITMAIIVVIEAIAWLVGRRTTEEVTPEPGMRVG